VAAGLTAWRGGRRLALQQARCKPGDMGGVVLIHGHNLTGRSPSSAWRVRGGDQQGDRISRASGRTAGSRKWRMAPD